MTTKIKIGLTMRVVETQGYKEYRDAISHDWIKYLDALGYMPVLIPSGISDLKEYLSALKITAVIFSNGNDVCELDKLEQVKENVDIYRDQFEKKMLDICMSESIPVLGVCRGLQFFNVYFGGSLITNIKESGITKISHVAKTHEIDLIHPQFKKWVQSDICSTNSYHNHGVTLQGLSTELEIAAHIGPIIEAVVHKSKPVVAIQWHPEREGSCSQLDEQLMSSLVKGFPWIK